MVEGQNEDWLVGGAPLILRCKKCGEGWPVVLRTGPHLARGGHLPSGKLVSQILQSQQTAGMHFKVMFRYYVDKW